MQRQWWDVLAGDPLSSPGPVKRVERGCSGELLALAAVVPSVPRSLPVCLCVGPCHCASPCDPVCLSRFSPSTPPALRYLSPTQPAHIKPSNPPTLPHYGVLTPLTPPGSGHLAIWSPGRFVMLLKVLLAREEKKPYGCASRSSLHFSSGLSS